MRKEFFEVAKREKLLDNMHFCTHIVFGENRRYPFNIIHFDALKVAWHLVSGWLRFKARGDFPKSQVSGKNNAIIAVSNCPCCTNYESAFLRVKSGKSGGQKSMVAPKNPEKSSPFFSLARVTLTNLTTIQQRVHIGVVWRLPNKYWIRLYSPNKMGGHSCDLHHLLHSRTGNTKIAFKAFKFVPLLPGPARVLLIWIPSISNTN